MKKLVLKVWKMMMMEKNINVPFERQDQIGLSVAPNQFRSPKG